MYKSEPVINEFFSYIHTFLRELMDIHQDEKKLKGCFSNNYVINQDKEALASYAFNIPVVSFKQENAVFKDLVIENANTFTSIQNINPIFLYAYVGQGKTTYLKYLIFHEWKNNPDFETLRKKTYFIYVAYTNDDDSCTYIQQDFFDKLTIKIEEILNEHNIDLHNNYNLLSSIFNADKIRYEMTTTNPTINGLREYIIKSKKHNGYYRRLNHWLLKEKGIKICCVIDNIDQHFRFIKESNYVVFERLFQSIFSYKVQAIIPLRISNRGFQSLGFFDSYHSIPINLGLPDFGNLIEKRLRYIQTHYNNALTNPMFKSGKFKIIDSNNIFQKFFSISELIKTNRNVKESIYKLSNNITREYIKIMINMFSGRALFHHPLTNDPIDYTSRVKQGKFYSLFIYSLMLRENKIHDESDDNVPIVNLFNNNSNNNWNTLIRYHLLLFLDKIAIEKIHINLFIEKFKELYTNINDESIISALKVFGKKKCIGIGTSEQIETKDITELINKRDCYIKIALRGKFHLELAKELEYYEVLAIRSFKDKKGSNAEIYNVSMSQRAENLKEFIINIKKDEQNLKAIFYDETKYKEYLFWSNNVCKLLLTEYSKVFKRKTRHNKKYSAFGK